MLGPGYWQFQNELTSSRASNSVRTAFLWTPAATPLPAGSAVPTRMAVEPARHFSRPMLSERFSKDDASSKPATNTGNAELGLATREPAGNDTPLAMVSVQYSLTVACRPPVLPVAHVLTERGASNPNFSQAPQFKKHLLVTAAALAAFPLPMAIGVALSYYLIGKITPAIFQRIAELHLLDAPRQPKALTGTSWRSATYSRDSALLRNESKLLNANSR